ncbi:hypothetical protein [Thauera humireducens]|uniref:Uncharacterized protein n=1 Tax=Thauera humireducens TaxID=1134435 RepID=A0A127K6K4_9RHOO|nr:hypothetical protein [Thauera humireducens]AMO37595.1 hypothetical protein AC731_011970 [Thauera humireducens]
MTTPTSHAHEHAPAGSHDHLPSHVHSHAPSHSHAPLLARAFPPRSLLGLGVPARLVLAALATGLLWLTVLWALN